MPSPKNEGRISREKLEVFQSFPCFTSAPAEKRCCESAITGEYLTLFSKEKGYKEDYLGALSGKKNFRTFSV